MSTLTADRIERIEPAAACGEHVVIDLAGPADPSGYTLSVSLGYTAHGPRETFSGVTVAHTTGTVIRVTIPKAATAALTPPTGQDRGVLYGEVWREDDGSARPLRRFSLGFYLPVRPTA